MNKIDIRNMTPYQMAGLSPISDHIFFTVTTDSKSAKECNSCKSYDSQYCDFLDNNNRISIGASPFRDDKYDTKIVNMPLIIKKHNKPINSIDIADDIDFIKSMNKSNVKVDIPDAAASIADNGSYLPKIKRVIFNDPSTIVFFEDGTKSIVKAAKGDKYSKETGIAFAITKRLLGKPDKNGVIQSDGYFQYVKKLINSGYDQIEAKKQFDKAIKRKR